MAKTSDAESTYRPSRIVRPSFQPSESDLIQMYYDRSSPHGRNKTPSARSSEEEWPITSTMFEQAERQGNIRTVRRRPHLSPLQIVPRSESPYELSSVPKVSTPPKTAVNIRFREAPTPSVSISVTPPTGMPRRSVTKLASTFSLRTLSRSFKRTSGLERDQSTSTFAQTPHTIPEMHIPSRTSSKQVPKMVPRGANERAPLLVLPPCPYDETEEAPATPWPLRTSPTVIPSPTSVQPYSFTTTRERRKSLPAVSSQV